MAKVLIVDDSETVLDFLSQFLKLKGYEVCCAGSKNELDRNFLSFNPDIILLDVRLQGEDGRVICKEIKASIPDIPVILISATQSLLENFALCDATDFISKPFDLENVLFKIRKALHAESLE